MRHFSPITTLKKLFGCSGLKTLLLIPVISMAACSYHPVKDGSLHAQPLGDFKKCADTANQDLPTCFCHSQSILKSPERINYCETEGVNDRFAAVDEHISTEVVLDLQNVRSKLTNTGDGWLKTQIAGKAPTRSKKWLQEFRVVTAQLEQPVKELIENWSDNTSLYLTGKTVYDDCDTSESLLDLAFSLGDFKMEELVKILVDSNPYDARPADHYVSAVWVNSNWMVLDQQDNKLKPLIHIELGGYMTRDGRLAPEGKIIAYRKLNQATWHEGRPPKV